MSHQAESQLLIERMIAMTLSTLIIFDWFSNRLAFVSFFHLLFALLGLFDLCLFLSVCICICTLPFRYFTFASVRLQLIISLLGVSFHLQPTFQKNFHQLWRWYLLVFCLCCVCLLVHQSFYVQVTLTQTTICGKRFVSSICVSLIGIVLWRLRNGKLSLTVDCGHLSNECPL